jgi:23S rRNA pseudouridine955/2504/2580 synthase
MSGVTTRQVSDDEGGMRLDRWFRQHFPDLAFGHLQKILRSGQVRVDGARVKGETRLEAGQTVRIPPLAPRPAATAGTQEEQDEANASRDWTTYTGEGDPRGIARSKPGASTGTRGTPGASRGAGALGIHDPASFLRDLLLYEDDAVFVFNKPFGLAVQGGSGLTRHIDGMLPALANKRGDIPRLVHRLDRDTTGVLVVARTRKAASELSASFRARSTKKIYWALVRGVPRLKQGRISSFLAKRKDEHGDDRMMMAKHGEEGADHALTYYAVVETSAQKLAWLSLRPVTGRTHQLRVHTAEMGHPIIGDPKYFNVENWELPGGIQKRLHLHARRIVMPLPSGGTLDVTAPLPPHMQQTWNLLGLDPKQYDPIEDAPER